MNNNFRNCWSTLQLFCFFVMHCLRQMSSLSFSLCLTPLSPTNTHTQLCLASQWGRCPLTPYLIVLMWVSERGSRNVTLCFSLLLLLLFFLEVETGVPEYCHVESPFNPLQTVISTMYYSHTISFTLFLEVSFHLLCLLLSPSSVWFWLFALWQRTHHPLKSGHVSN